MKFHHARDVRPEDPPSETITNQTVQIFLCFQDIQHLSWYDTDFLDLMSTVILVAHQVDDMYQPQRTRYEQGYPNAEPEVIWL